MPNGFQRMTPLVGTATDAGLKFGFDPADVGAGRCVGPTGLTSWQSPQQDVRGRVRGGGSERAPGNAPGAPGRPLALRVEMLQDRTEGAATEAEKFGTAHEDSTSSSVLFDNEMYLHDNATGRVAGGNRCRLPERAQGAGDASRLRTIQGRRPIGPPSGKDWLLPRDPYSRVQPTVAMTREPYVSPVAGAPRQSARTVPGAPSVRHARGFVARRRSR